jgi:hypothetical protein
MGKISKKFKLGPSTSSICRKLENEKVFDRIHYLGQDGCQPGAYVELWKGDYNATLRREKPSVGGYNGSFEKPTKIAYLVMDKKQKCYGFFDPNEMIKSPRHRFEEDAEKDTGLRIFLEEILRYFN